MLNEIVLVGKYKGVVNEDAYRKAVVIEVDRPFKEENLTTSDSFICRVWGAIFNKVVNYCENGDLLAIRGRVVCENNSYYIEGEKIVILNKTNHNI